MDDNLFRPRDRFRGISDARKNGRLRLIEISWLSGQLHIAASNTRSISTTLASERIFAKERNIFLFPNSNLKSVPAHFQYPIDIF
jgi:hypothetical protein